MLIQKILRILSQIAEAKAEIMNNIKKGGILF